MGFPYELADELPAKYRPYLPKFEERADGTYFVRPRTMGNRERNKADSADMMSIGGEFRVDRTDERAMRQMVTGNATPTSFPGFTPEERLAEMALENVVGEVLLGMTAVGVSLANNDAHTAYCRLVNDWQADTYRDHMRQFAPSINFPLHDLEVGAEEIVRASSMGLRPIALPDVVPGMPYSNPMWEPVWEAAEACDVPVFLHLSGAFGAIMKGVGAERGTPGLGETGFAITTAGAMVSLGWFVNGGILERHPKLTVAMIECNAGWLPYAMQQWDHVMHSRFIDNSRVQYGGRGMDLEAPPSYYVRRQVKCQFMWDPAAVDLRHEIGMDVLMWGNDYPHFEGAFPNSQAWIDKQFAGVPEDEVMQIVHDNAAKLLKITA
ncbi:amidohydrolase family protein [Pseudofrankia sp. BMG5.37]|uniref:amidohydrolase family protein n=1 Tax=Pseudofrankia sp. BMG5.37 TaxID=3050035 RepID=UPI00289491BB|nr:amidohydrolase family protein [Pseudofrankia sp. BMG5.37]MDT3439217.1 amidohydrolase family protein [Pseudofrankia sp. BMG5.37]